MRSAEFPQDNGSGSKTYPGVYWADQIPSKDVVDYEKCVYFITGARMMHSDAETACASNVVSKCSTLDCPATLGNFKDYLNSSAAAATFSLQIELLNFAQK